MGEQYDYESTLNNYRERLTEYKDTASRLINSDSPLEGFRTATDVIGTPLSIELLKSGIKTRFGKTAFGARDKIDQMANDLKEKIKSKIKSTTEKTDTDAGAEAETEAPASRSFFTPASEAPVREEDPDEPFGITRGVVRVNTRPVEGEGETKDAVEGDAEGAVEGTAEEAGVEGATEGAVEAGAVATESIGETIAATTGPETAGIGAVIGGLVTLGGVLASVFAPHHHKHEPQNPLPTTPALQIGLGN